MILVAFKFSENVITYPFEQDDEMLKFNSSAEGGQAGLSSHYIETSSI
jgi:hypothetical protein